MKIVLVNPRYDENQYRYRVSKMSPPLGMCYIASKLLEEGHDVKLLDMEVLSLELSELTATLSAERPDIIGIHGTTPIAPRIAECAKVSKDTCSTAVIVVGGPHATLLPEEIFQNMPEVDIAVRGEAEYTFCQIVQHLDQGKEMSSLRSIPGVCFRLKDDTHISEDSPLVADLDALPLPAYDLLPFHIYSKGSRLVETDVDERIFPVITSRGCPYECIFCSTPVLYGHKYRTRSAKNVVDEVSVLVEDYGITHIVFYDASFMCSTQRVVEICDEILRRNVKVTWRARARADKAEIELLELMKRAGCTTLAFGVETGSQRLLDILKKRVVLEKVEAAFQMAREVGLWTVGYFILGIPSETRDELLETIEFAKKLDPDFALFTTATPLPGTELYRMARTSLITDDWSQFRFSANSPVVSYDQLSNVELSELMDYAYRSFYVRKEWLSNRLRKAKTQTQIQRILNSFFHYLEDTKDSREATGTYDRGAI